MNRTNRYRQVLAIALCLSSLTMLIMTGCDELITEEITNMVAGHPIADFALSNGSVDSGCVPLSVTFVDLSDGPRTRYIWDYGDGQIDTVLDSISGPTHTYTSAGSFRVTLSIFDLETEGVDIESKGRFVIVGQSIDSLSFAPDSGCPGTEVSFLVGGLHGVNTDSLIWRFGDNSSADTGISVAHTYTSAGDFQVSLSATGGCGTAVLVDTVHVRTCPLPAFVVDSSDTSVKYVFGQSGISGCAPLKIVFIDSSQTSSDSTIIDHSLTTWSFVDTNGAVFATSNEADTMITFTTGGVYSVVLSVQDDQGDTATGTTVDYVTVYDVPSANFAAATSRTGCFSQYRQFQVKLQDSSLGNIIGWHWDVVGVGDSITDTVQNPIFAFTKLGSYAVRLTVDALCGLDTLTTDTSFLSYVVLSALPVMDSIRMFVSPSDSGDTATSFTFSDSTNEAPFGAITQWQWQFGDGSSASGRSVQHSYDTAGVYLTTLTLSNHCGSANKDTTIIVTAGP